jgi:murein DD-endopeptidase MepM/ murein hydrolase activator NlpD
MVGELWQRGASRLPEIRSIIQATGNAVELIRVQRAYTVAAAAMGIAVVAVAFAGVSAVRHSRDAADVEMTTSRIESANVDLQDELARLRDKVAASSRDLAAAQSRVAGLAEEEKARAQQLSAAEQTAPVKGDKVTQLSSALHITEAQRATLAARLSKAEADLAEQQAKQSQLQNELDEWQKKLQQITADHDQAISERDRLRARVGELEKQSALRHAAQSVAATQPAPAQSAVPARAAAVAPAAPAVAEAPQRVAGILNAPPPAASPQPVAAPVAVEHGVVDQFARVLASAGVDVRHLFAEFGVNRAEGGPFVPVAPGQVPNPSLSPEKLAALRTMIKSLPVYTPLESYRITSPFGVRADPENDREGFHTGVDLAAPYDTPVYATAPGTVTFAGWRDDYGKIVEIDHGNGIATRYAHLHQFTVSVGQRVAAHAQIGYLGSSGRATGPHVHYEVVVNGEPQDPEKFFALSRYVPPMTVPVAARN